MESQNGGGWCRMRMLNHAIEDAAAFQDFEKKLLDAAQRTAKVPKAFSETYPLETRTARRARERREHKASLRTKQ